MSLVLHCLDSPNWSFWFGSHRRVTIEERGKLVESLWQVAFADNDLDKYEEASIRKISDLLYVSHGDFIKAKHAAQQESGEP